MPGHGIAHGHRAVLLGLCVLVAAAGCAVGVSGTPNDPPSTTPTPAPASASAPAPAPAAMATIPAGRYPLGDPAGAAEEQPAHTVELPAFRLDTRPVTTEEFVTWANANAGRLTNASGGQPRTWDGPLNALEVDTVRDAGGREVFSTDDSDDDSRVLRRDGRFAVETGFADHPVNEVYWWGAVLYCEARDARLPTEAEWEAAARGVEGRTYPWGDDAPDATRAQFDRPYGETAPVDAHPAGATPQGVRDMAGNLYEWTSSLEAPYPYSAGDGREDRDSLEWRVIKGGRHDEGAQALRAADRDGYSPDPFAGHHHIGFRCAADAL